MAITGLSKFLSRVCAFELRDVGARDEGLVARTREHHGANSVIGAEVAEHLWDRLPHVERYGVAPLGIVEDEPADGTILPRDDALSGHTTPCARRPAMSFDS